MLVSLINRSQKSRCRTVTRIQVAVKTLFGSGCLGVLDSSPIGLFVIDLCWSGNEVRSSFACACRRGSSIKKNKKESHLSWGVQLRPSPCLPASYGPGLVRSYVAQSSEITCCVHGSFKVHVVFEFDSALPDQWAY